MSDQPGDYTVHNESLTVLVTGATGAVGPRVVQALRNEGCRVRTLSFDAPPAEVWPNEVEMRRGDITDLACVISAVQGVDVVIHMAALLHIINPPSELRIKYERINVGGTANVVEAAVRANVKRVVFFSTIAVYGDSGGQILHEDSEIKPDTLYAQSKSAAEQLVLAARRSDGQPLGTVLRLGAVYGSRIKGNYQRLLTSLARGRFVPIGRGTNRRTLVYDRDVAAAALLAARHPDAGGRVYNVSDGRFYALSEILAAMCGALGRVPPRIALPVTPVRLAAGMLEDTARLFGRTSPLGRMTIDKYTEDVAVSSDRIRTELGYAAKFDLAAGWQETVDEMRQCGTL